MDYEHVHWNNKLHDLRGKVINFCILKILIEAQRGNHWYENSEGTGSVAVVSATSWMFKKIPF